MHVLGRFWNVRPALLTMLFTTPLFAHPGGLALLQNAVMRALHPVLNNSIAPYFQGGM